MTNDPKLHNDLMGLIAAGMKDAVKFYFATPVHERTLFMEIMRDIDETALVELMNAVTRKEAYCLGEYLRDELNRRQSAQKDEVN